MTTILEDFADTIGADSRGYVEVRAYDFRNAVSGLHTVTPETRRIEIQPGGEFEVVCEPGPTVFDIWIRGINVRTRTVDVPATGVFNLRDLTVLADPGTANLDSSVIAALSTLTWGDFS